MHFWHIMVLASVIPPLFGLTYEQLVSAYARKRWSAVLVTLILHAPGVDVEYFRKKEKPELLPFEHPRLWAELATRGGFLPGWLMLMPMTWFFLKVSQWGLLLAAFFVYDWQFALFCAIGAGIFTLIVSSASSFSIRRAADNRTATQPIESAPKRTAAEDAESIVRSTRLSKGSSVALFADGRSAIIAGEDPSFGESMEALGVIFSRELVSETRDEVAAFLGLPQGRWDEQHERAFALLFVRYIRESGARCEAPQAIVDVCTHLTPDTPHGLQPVGSLPPEITKILDALFQVPEEQMHN